MEEKNFIPKIVIVLQDLTSFSETQFKKLDASKYVIEFIQYIDHPIFGAYPVLVNPFESSQIDSVKEN